MDSDLLQSTVIECHRSGMTVRQINRECGIRNARDIIVAWWYEDKRMVSEGKRRAMEALRIEREYER